VIYADDDDCRLRFDGSCSVGETFEWTIDVTGNAGGPYVQSGMVVTQQFGSRCDEQNITVQLTVTSGGGASVSTQTITRRLPEGDLKAWLSTSGLDTSFTSFLDATNAGALVVINNSRRDTMECMVEHRHSFRGIAGKNTIEAHTTSRLEGNGIWHFDFSGAGHFATGSLRVEQGQVVSVSGHAIVFRLTKNSGNRIRFTFDLHP
jgi:hypothetical protein